MKTSKYLQHVIDTLVIELTNTERNYRAFREEWERLNLECKDLVEQGYVIISPELQNNHNNRHATFERMQELDQQSKALMTAIKAVKEHA